MDTNVRHIIAGGSHFDGDSYTPAAYYNCPDMVFVPMEYVGFDSIPKDVINTLTTFTTKMIEDMLHIDLPEPSTHGKNNHFTLKPGDIIYVPKMDLHSDPFHKCTVVEKQQFDESTPQIHNILVCNFNDINLPDNFGIRISRVSPSEIPKDLDRAYIDKDLRKAIHDVLGFNTKTFVNTVIASKQTVFYLALTRDEMNHLPSDIEIDYAIKMSKIWLAFYRCEVVQV